MTPPLPEQLVKQFLVSILVEPDIAFILLLQEQSGCIYKEGSIKMGLKY